MPENTWEVLPPEESNGSAREGRRSVAATASPSRSRSPWPPTSPRCGSSSLPPLQWTLDLATAVALFLVLGRQWLILPALVAEAIPGVAALPAWVLVVGSIAMWGTVTPGGRPAAVRGRLDDMP